MGFIEVWPQICQSNCWICPKPSETGWSTKNPMFPEGLIQIRWWQKAVQFITWWLILLGKWFITSVINGISRVNPLITGVITHLLSGMNHQVHVRTTFVGSRHNNYSYSYNYTTVRYSTVQYTTLHYTNYTTLQLQQELQLQVHFTTHYTTHYTPHCTLH